MPPIRFALAGVGNIAAVHARALQNVADAQLIAVHARDFARAHDFAVRWNAFAEADFDALLARPDVDALLIATPSGTHADLGIRAARAGKHVLCEKPLDISVARVDELIAACETNGVQLGAIFQARFGVGARVLKTAVDAGRFGILSHASATVAWYRDAEYYASAGWRGTWALDGGGALMNQSIHALDLLVWLMGEVAQVGARCANVWHRDLEVEDSASAWLHFRNGALGTIFGSTACFPGAARRIEIHGTRGSATLEDDRLTRWEFADETPADVAIRAGDDAGKIGGGASDPKAIGNEGHRVQIEDFAAAIRENRAPAIAGREARAAVALIEAIYRSSRENRVVEME